MGVAHYAAALLGPWELFITSLQGGTDGTKAMLWELFIIDLQPVAGSTGPAVEVVHHCDGDAAALWIRPNGGALGNRGR